jgi:hypothetical protein
MPRLPSADDLAGSRPSIRVAGGVTAARPSIDIPKLGGEAVGVAAVGEALAKTSVHFADVAKKQQEHEDTLRVEDAFNSLRESQLDLTLGQENGFTQLRGGDAANRDVLKDWTTRFDDQTKKLADGLGDDAQRERFRQRSAVARASFEGDILRHVDQQKKVYAENVYKGTIDLETRSAMANWSDPAAIGLSLTRIDNAVMQEAQRNGWSPEATAATRMHAVSALHSSVIGQALEAGDTDYAQRYYDETKTSIDPSQVKAIGRAVSEGVQKQVASGYQSQLIDNRNDRKALGALEQQVAQDPRLDDERRNILMGRITARGDRLDTLATHEADKRLRVLQRGIDSVNRLTLAGYEPTAEQMLPLVAAAKGTELEPEVRQMIAVANATRQFRLATPQQQEATITSIEAEVRKDPTKFDVTVVDRFKRIHDSQQREIRDDPTTFAVRQGLVNPDDPAGAPIDWSDPSKIGAQLQARFDLGRTLQARYQAPFKPLTKEDADLLSAALRKAPVEDKRKYFAALSTAAGTDFDGYKAVIAQIAPDEPVTAHAGILAGRGRLAADAGFSPEAGRAMNVADVILRGQAALHPDRKADGQPDKGKLWPMPKDADFEKLFQGYERDAFAGKPEARNGFFQTAKAYYAGRTIEAGDSSGVIDSGRWEEAMKVVTGGIERWNGKSLVMPWGYSRWQFKDGLYARIDDLVASGRLDQNANAGRLRDMPMESVGDGRYVFRSGDGILVDSTGRPVTVDFNTAIAPRAPGVREQRSREEMVRMGEEARPASASPFRSPTRPQ